MRSPPLTAKKHRANSSRRDGFTLIELLIATAVTLLLVAALTQAFQVVGGAVGDNRGMLEMAGQLRGVAVRLETDLGMVTSAMSPLPQPGVGKGYFEYVEGWDHDGSPYLIGDTSFGDVDDLVMFTAQSSERPFVGVQTNSTGTGVTSLESNQAEIAWWTTLNDINASDTIDPDQREDFTVYRRVLLIRPNLFWTDINGNGIEDPAEAGVVTVLPGSGSYNITNQTDLRDLYNDLRQFYGENDISVRIVRRFVPAGSSNLQVLLVANSLEELTRRENRFAHSRIVAEDPSNSGNLLYFPRLFPHHVDRDFTSATSLPLIRQPDLINFPFEEPGLIKAGLYNGEDVALAHTTAFDIRAFDPFAVVGVNPGQDSGWGVEGEDDDGNTTTDDRSNLSIEQTEAGWPGSDDQAVGPGDPGYLIAPAGGLNNLSPGRAVLPIGRGAFVDLFYTTKLHRDSAGLYSYTLIDQLLGSTSLPSPPHSTLSSVNDPGYASTFYSHFSGPPRAFVRGGTRWLGIEGTRALNATSLAVYDTWSFDYEIDGVNQDGNALTDEGTDGLDNDGVNGVDDVAERETSPPYPFKLRGLQTRIRIIEHDSRQVRQITVESDFTPE
jgi:prepilin-type N-terminal cleavage/methylation domain-containing protein